VVEWRRFFFFSPLLLCVFPFFLFLFFSCFCVLSSPISSSLFFVLSSLFSFLFSVFLFSPFLLKNPNIFLLSLMSLPCFFRSLSTPPKNLSLCFSPFLFFFLCFSPLYPLFFFCFLTPKSSVHSSLFFSKSFSLLKNSLLCSLVLFLLFFSRPPYSPISPHIYKQGERGHPVLSRHGIG